MNLFTRCLGMFRTKRAMAPESVQAKELSQRIAEKADALTEHLQTYQRSRDPFAALMADMYNRDQVSKIWLNGGTK